MVVTAMLVPRSWSIDWMVGSTMIWRVDLLTVAPMTRMGMPGEGVADGGAERAGVVDLAGGEPGGIRLERVTGMSTTKPSSRKKPFWSARMCGAKTPLTAGRAKVIFSWAAAVGGAAAPAAAGAAAGVGARRGALTAGRGAAQQGDDDEPDPYGAEPTHGALLHPAAAPADTLTRARPAPAAAPPRADPGASGRPPA